MLQICWSPGLRPGPRWGSLQRSPRPPRWWGGGSLPLPKNPNPAFGPTGLKLRPYGPRASDLRASPYRPPTFKTMHTPMGPQVTVEPGPLRALLRHCALACQMKSSPDTETGNDLPVPICRCRACVNCHLQTALLQDLSEVFSEQPVSATRVSWRG